MRRAFAGGETRAIVGSMPRFRFTITCRQPAGLFRREEQSPELAGSSPTSRSRWRASSSAAWKSSRTIVFSRPKIWPSRLKPLATKAIRLPVEGNMTRARIHGSGRWCLESPSLCCSRAESAGGSFINPARRRSRAQVRRARRTHPPPPRPAPPTRNPSPCCRS